MNEFNLSYNNFFVDGGLIIGSVLGKIKYMKEIIYKIKFMIVFK